MIPTGGIRATTREYRGETETLYFYFKEICLKLTILSLESVA